MVYYRPRLYGSARCDLPGNRALFSAMAATSESLDELVPLVRAMLSQLEQHSAVQTHFEERVVHVEERLAALEPVGAKVPNLEARILRVELTILKIQGEMRNTARDAAIQQDRIEGKLDKLVELVAPLVATASAVPPPAPAPVPVPVPVPTLVSST